MSPDKAKKGEIEMKPNQAYETVTLPSSSRRETQVHTKPCPAYEVVVHAYHWGLNILILFAVSYSVSDTLEEEEIEMKPSQAFETVTLPSPSKPATQVHTKQFLI